MQLEAMADDIANRLKMEALQHAPELGTGLR
jgi:hypothetical protein